jgi:hypothetical protein
MADLLFRKGSVANIATAALVPGAISITTDEPGIYLDLAATDAGAKGTAQRVRVGDFIPVASLDALKARLDAGEKFSTQALYYAIDQNMLLRFDGSRFAWINDQTAITARVENLEAVDTEINDTLQEHAQDIADEVTNRTNAIAGLQSQIDALTGAGGEGTTSLAGLAAALQKETNDRIAADETHTNDIANHTTEIGNNTAAITALTKLVGSLPSGVSGTMVAYLAGLVSTEETRAKAAEQANATAIAGHATSIQELTTGLAQEITDARAAESENARLAQKGVDDAAAALKAAQDEATRALAREAELNSAIADNANDITLVDNKIDTAITNINTSISGVNSTATDAQTKANANATAIAKEVTDREAAITSVRNDFAAADGVLQNSINGINSDIADMKVDIADNTEAISDEAARADAEEKRLAGLIDSNAKAIAKEVKDRADEITRLAGLIDSSTGAHNGLVDTVTAQGKKIEALEGTNQIQGEQISANAQAISNEVTRATKAEQANAKAISDEVTRATNAENQLRTDLNSETSNRTAAINTAKTELKKYADDKDAALKKIIEDNIAAANCMTFKGGVSGFTGQEALPLSDIHGGDTYVVTAAFNNGIYQIGDLLVASDDFAGPHTAGSADQIAFWTHVQTGYSTWQDSKLSVENNIIKLKSHLDEVLGTIEVKSSSENILVSTTGSGTDCSVEVSFVWGTF